jgi:glyoxylase-like metal-dependent hydrolase (beta-lactamase superfamily II)/rhodanese-related sulfurtransferase
LNSTSIAIDVETLRRMLDNREPVTVLDVRPLEERQEWRIPGSIHVDAYSALNAGDRTALDGLDVPSDRPIVTVCAAGRTSLLAALLLREQGLDAWSLEGGMESWSLAWNVAVAPSSQDNVTILQVRRVGKGCLSYIIGSGDDAAVVDAALDPSVYVELAERNGWRIGAVVDTHIHADHLSRSRLLADQTGATLYLPAQDRAAYSFTPLSEGDQITIGSARLRAMHTPGHTLESMSFLLDDLAVFTGDTLFLDGVGRPDLEASIDEARVRANLLYDSVSRLLQLPEHVLVLPGHTSIEIPFDGESIDLPVGEVSRNLAVRQQDKEEFVSWILSRIPPTPPNHHIIVQLNEVGLLPGIANHTGLEAGANRCAVS